MATRLKRLDLHGFKSFATPTTFVFDTGITAVIGPNGSGKSNISDALRWVLGEQSYANLRGERTEDIIFAGSAARAPLGMAEVTVTLDNEDGSLPVAFLRGQRHPSCLPQRRKSVPDQRRPSPPQRRAPGNGLARPVPHGHRTGTGRRRAEPARRRAPRPV